MMRYLFPNEEHWNLGSVFTFIKDLFGDKILGKNGNTQLSFTHNRESRRAKVIAIGNSWIQEGTKFKKKLSILLATCDAINRPDR